MFNDLFEQFDHDGHGFSVREMAKASGRYSGKTFYHGTPRLSWAKSIVKNGIVPDMNQDKYDPESTAKPVEGRVYVTPNLRYATIYALSGVFMGHTIPESDIEKNGRYGFVFQMDGSQFDDVQPDEDSVGEMVAYSMEGGVRSEELSWLVDLVHELVEEDYLSSDIVYSAVDGEVDAQIQVGKEVLEHLSDRQKIALIDAGAHVSHGGVLAPDKVWVIDKTKSHLLKDDVSNFSDVAFQISEGNLMNLDEATASQIRRKQKSVNKLFPQFPERVKAVQDKGGLRLKKVDQETWKWKIHSGTKSDVWYDAVLHFKNVEPLLRKLVADRRLWNKDRTKINLNKLSREFMKRADIQLECSCPAQKYWGGDYVLSRPKYDAKYGDPENRAPNVRNPRQYGAHCKHLQNLFKALPFYADTVAKWLNDFYPELIGEVEKEAGAEAEKFKRAGEELRKRKVAKEEPVRKPVRPAKAEEEPRVAEPRKEPERESEREEEPQKEEPERKVEPEKEEPVREEEPQKEEERPAKAQEPEKEELPDQAEEPKEEDEDEKGNRKIWTT